MSNISTSYHHNDNDIVIYTDIDRIDFFRDGTFHSIWNEMIQRNADIVLESLPHIENKWNKEDVLISMNASYDMRYSRQYNANVMMIRNNPIMRTFFRALASCNTDYHMISDEP